MASSVYFTKVAAGTGREAIGVCMDHEWHETPKNENIIQAKSFQYPSFLKLILLNAFHPDTRLDR